MNNDIFRQLINNAVLLMALSVVYEISYIFHAKNKKLVPVINGILIGIIALAVMTLPFELSKGIVFDTRSILISVSAVVFGPIPTFIAAVIAIIYRAILAGTGVYTGISTIITSAAIGLIWRKRIFSGKPMCRWLNIYILGVTVHVVMLLCMFLMPYPVAVNVIREIGLPVLLIYPVGTVLLSMLLLHQKERNEALIKVVEEEERYKSLFYNNHAIMMLIDPEDGRIIDVNPAACKFYGWSEQEMKKMNVSQINTLTADEIKAEMIKSVNEKRNHFMFKHRRAYEEPVDVEVYSGPIKFLGKKLLYSIVHDITERTIVIKALQESESRFRLLVESAPDAIFIQTGGKFAYINNAALKLFGAENKDQLIGKSVMDRFHHDYHKAIQERIELLNKYKKAVPPLEQIYIKLDGSFVYVDVSAVPILYEGLNGAIVFARDITDRKEWQIKKDEVEAQLRQQQKLEAIGTLAGGVAHEINNPINGIMNYAQLILDSAEGNSGYVEYAKEIINETERISVIVRNLLQFSRQEKQTHSYAAIYDIVNQTISLIKTIIKKDQIELDVVLDDNLPEIKCRSQQIQQVLMNLLTNARDALNEKYPEYNEDKIIKVRCSHYFKDSRRWLKLTVEDHGNGIPTELQDKIFEPFFSTKPKEKGTGLGLSISFGIVKDHHGKISIETKEGLYTRFILDLPVDNG